jgi:nitrite reductase/ring-hydroxylating ferredoxin subunit
MKKYILLFVLVGVAFAVSCDKDDLNYNNKNLPNYSFQIKIDMSQPLYNELKFTGNAVMVTMAGAGINGVIVTNTGTGYTAFEASCPNQPLTSCSMLTLKDIMAKCPCDNVEYFLYTGEATTPVQYPLKPYRIQQTSSTMLLVSN